MRGWDSSSAGWELSHSLRSGILGSVRFTPAEKDAISVAGKPPATGALAGIYLLATLILCIGIGLLGGWVAGHLLAGGAVGAAIGIPSSFYYVYRTFNDL
jgi:hypothetical protein